MSNGNTAIPVSPIAQIMQSLQEGEAAKAQVPELQNALKAEQIKAYDLSVHNQRLEENIIGYKNQISDLLARTRKLEGERDDAAFHQLESEDRVSIALKAIRNAVRDLDGSALQLDPPKPEPVVSEVKPDPTASTIQGGSQSATTVTGQGATDSPVKVPEVPMPTSEGQSVADPTVSSQPISGNQSESALSTTVRSNEPVTGTEPYQPFTPPSPDAKPVQIAEERDRGYTYDDGYHDSDRFR